VCFEWEKREERKKAVDIDSLVMWIYCDVRKFRGI